MFCHQVLALPGWITFIVILNLSCDQAYIHSLAWLEVTSESKPWSRWWWHGSSVTKEGITAELEAYAKAGLGGLELTPIYGVIGDEENFVEFLSPQWMELLEYTLSEANRLGLGIDMAAGTGWPFGGPWVSGEEACKYLAHKSYILKAGEKLQEKVVYEQEPFIRAVSNQVYQQYRLLDRGEEMTGSMPDASLIGRNKALQIEDLIDPVENNPDLQGKSLDQVRFKKDLPLQTLMAYGPADQIVDLTEKVSEDGFLEWTASAGEWKLYAVFQGWHGKMVERAAPGGEGNVIDHFSSQAIRVYLSHLDSAFTGRNLSNLRAFFNDSYEVDDARGQANWTPGFLEEFEKRRGYDLRKYLPALLEPDSQQINLRVLSDFRETFSDLILETFTLEWASWAKEKGKIIRNQPHGAPANILDLYGESDIPETEGTQILRIKFASSAAHVAGRQLVSAEAATWLNEHFISNLADIKENLDHYLIGGVNHIFYHGTCYSPPDDEWPGRLFYAAIHANPRNPLWREWSTLNQYIARSQSLLQSGVPDNDVLLYFPMYDRFATPGPELLEHFDGHGPTLEGTALEKDALYLQENGYTFDFISDRQIEQLEVSEGGLQTGGTEYRTILVPPCRYMPLSTFRKLNQLAEQGATIVFHQHLPENIPGLGDLEVRQQEFESLKSKHAFVETKGFDTAPVGAGFWAKGEDLDTLLSFAGVKPEGMTSHGLEFARRKNNDDETIYFITSWKQPIDQWIPIAKDAKSVTVFDPMTGKMGLAKIRTTTQGSLEVYLSLKRGDGILLITRNDVPKTPSWPYYKKENGRDTLTGTWTLRFLEGGPTLPEPVNMEMLDTWTQLEGELYRSFSGTAIYSLSFNRPLIAGTAFLLDLGIVHETARVRLNGEDLGACLGPDYQILFDYNKIKEENLLEIEVTNLMANRIAHLERNGVFWKRFYNINFPPHLAENRGRNGLFDALTWQPLPSGLLGPVTLTSRSSDL